MSWVRRNLHWVLLVSFVLSAAGALGLGVVGVLAAALAVATTGGIVVPLLETLIPFVLPVVVLAGLSVVFFLGTFVTTTRRAIERISIPRPSLPRPSWPRSEGLMRRAEALERRVPALRGLDLPGKFEPTPEQRRQRLKQQYVDGEVDEFEFERRMARIVDDADGGAEGPGSGGGPLEEGGEDRERDPGTNIAVE